MSTNSLQWNNSTSLDLRSFLRANNMTRLDIVFNQKNNKYFFVTNGAEPITGAISSKVSHEEIMEDPMITQVTGDSNEPFWMLHKRSTSNVVKSFTV